MVQLALVLKGLEVGLVASLAQLDVERLLRRLRVPHLRVLFRLLDLERNVVLFRLLSQILQHLLADDLLRLLCHCALLLAPGAGLTALARRLRELYVIGLRAQGPELLLLHDPVVGLLGHDPPVVFAPEMLLRRSVQLEVDTEQPLAFLGVVEHVTQFFVDAAAANDDIVHAHLKRPALHRLGAVERRLLNRVRRNCAEIFQRIHVLLRLTVVFLQLVVYC